MYRDYLILGSGIAAVRAAQGIRSRGPGGSLLLLTQERQPPYSRPMLTKAPLRAFWAESPALYERAWYDGQNIELLLDTPVEGIDPRRHTVRAGGREIGYGKCVYALGAANFIPPIPGADKKNVLSLRTAQDVARLKRCAAGAQAAVVIGGGAIGLEAAFALTGYGLAVTVLEAAPHLMPQLLDAGTAGDFKAGIRAFPIHTGVEIAAICGGQEARRVRLHDGRSFPCSLVVVSCGVRANTRPAKEAGLRCGRGVTVNRRMETSQAGIYACGDCAEIGGASHALWSQAALMGETAGINAAGGEREYGGCDTSLVFNTPETALFACGDLGKDPRAIYRCETQALQPGGRFFVNPVFGAARRRLFYRGDTLVGASLLGNLAQMEALKRQIAAGEGAR